MLPILPVLAARACLKLCLRIICVPQEQKACRNTWLFSKHALRGGLLPVISYLGPAFAALLSGSFVVETIFQIPGLGRFYVQAAFNRDYTMILGTTVFLSTLIVVFNLLSDIAAAWVNPRLRYQFKK